VVTVGGVAQPVSIGPGRPARLPIGLEARSAVDVSVDGRHLGFEVIPGPMDPGAITVTGFAFPTDPDGRADPSRPADAVVLPPRAWDRWLLATGLGGRRSPLAAVAWQALTLSSAADAPIDLVVWAEVVDPAGQVVPAFRSRVRDQQDLPYVSVLVRVPAHGEATAAIPVWVAEDEVEGVVTATRRVRVAPLGAAAPVAVLEAPIGVRRATIGAPSAFALAVAASIVGWGWLARGWRRFLATTPTSDLVTIALFAAATFAVGAAFQLVGAVIATALGPLAPLITGLPDDAFRAVLLATLLTLLPRVGVFAAAAAIGFLMRGLVLGSFHPVDWLYVGSSIALHEAGLWLAGITRDPRWRDGSAAARWSRLTIGLGVPNAVAVVLGLASTAMLYRLWFAGWYVAALALIPGLLYVAIGCRLAVPIADGLRRIAP
ncbi:MAG: hypothetical protein ABMB14_33775, partial [Myxococcota bacterium]